MGDCSLRKVSAGVAAVVKSSDSNVRYIFNKTWEEKKEEKEKENRNSL